MNLKAYFKYLQTIFAEMKYLDLENIYSVIFFGFTSVLSVFNTKFHEVKHLFHVSIKLFEQY